MHQFHPGFCAARSKRPARMLKFLVIFVIVATALSAEIPTQATLHIKDNFKPEVEEAIETHPIFKKQTNSEHEHRPVYRSEEHQNQGRARIEPVRPIGPVVKHDMLADQPLIDPVTGLKANDQIYGYTLPTLVEYPDIPYAPNYGYDQGYVESKNYEVLDNNGYYMEPDMSTFGLLWSQVPDSRTFVSYAGRTIKWMLHGILVLILGSFVTVGLCSYTNICKITFNGVGPIHEEMRSLITPERLEKISNAADFVKTAINKYQTIQHVSEPGTRKRRAINF